MKTSDFTFFLFLLVLMVVGCRDTDPVPEPPTASEQFVLDKQRIDSLIIENGWEEMIDTTAMGTRYLVLDSGSGKKLELNDIVHYEYTISLITGEVVVTSVDSVAERDSLNEFNQRIYTYTSSGWAVNTILENINSYPNHEAGFKEGLTAASRVLHVGGTAVILVPSLGAYGPYTSPLDAYLILRGQPIIYELQITNAE